MTGKDLLLLALREKIDEVYNHGVNISSLAALSLKDNIEILEIISSVKMERDSFCSQVIKRIHSVVHEYCTANPNNQIIRLINKSNTLTPRFVIILETDKETSEFCASWLSGDMKTLRQAIQQVENFAQPIAEIFRDEKKLFELLFFGCDPSSDIYRIYVGKLNSRVNYPKSLNDILSPSDKNAWFRVLDLLNIQLVATSNDELTSAVKYLRIGNIVPLPEHFQTMAVWGFNQTKSVFTVDQLFKWILPRYPFLFVYIVTIIHMNYDAYKKRIFKYMMR